MQKINLLSPRLKTVFIDIGKPRQVSLHDYYKSNPDEAARAIRKEIQIENGLITVSDSGCLFNYFEYIRWAGFSNIELIGYNNGLVFEIK